MARGDLVRHKQPTDMEPYNRGSLHVSGTQLAVVAVVSLVALAVVALTAAVVAVSVAVVAVALRPYFKR